MYILKLIQEVFHSILFASKFINITVKSRSRDVPNFPSNAKKVNILPRTRELVSEKPKLHVINSKPQIKSYLGV